MWSVFDRDQAARRQAFVVLGALTKEMSGHKASDCIGNPQHRLGFGAPVVTERNTTVRLKRVEDFGPVALVAGVAAPFDDQVVDSITCTTAGMLAEEVSTRGDLSGSSDRTPEACTDKARILDESHHALDRLGSFLGRMERATPIADDLAEGRQHGSRLGDPHDGEVVVDTRPSLMG